MSIQTHRESATPQSVTGNPNIDTNAKQANTENGTAAARNV